jgi:hypothetical protein
MALSGNKGERQTTDRCLWVLTVGSALVCFVFLALYLTLSKREFTVDTNVLALLFAGIGFLFLPFFSKLKIVGVLEVERLQANFNEVKGLLLRGEVVRTEEGSRFYIDSEGKRYSIPDDQTAHFLRSSKGELQISGKDIVPYPLAGQMESVLKCELLHWNGHVFAVLNGKKYHVGSASHLADWGRPGDYQSCSDEQIRKYPIGR